MAVDSISRSNGKAYETTDVNMQNDKINDNDFKTSSSDESKNPSKREAPVDNVAIPQAQNSELQKAISEFKKKINPNTIAEFGIHEPTKRITIKIVDKDTDKVIKEYPPEKTLEMIAKVWELAGIMVDEKL